jgi:hypothetical protein
LKEGDWLYTGRMPSAKMEIPVDGIMCRPRPAAIGVCDSHTWLKRRTSKATKRLVRKGDFVVEVDVHLD